MIELATGDFQDERFEARVAPRVVKGVAGVADEPLSAASSAIRLSPPLITPLTEELIGADAELKAFWNAEKGAYRYHYVRMRASFDPGNAFSEARIALRLKSDGPPGSVVAWSMAPTAENDPSSLTASAKLGVDIKFVKLEANVEKKIPTGALIVQGLGEQTDAPTWILKKTATQRIEGPFVFHVITRTAQAQPASGTLEAMTLIDKLRVLFGRKEDPGPTPIPFVIPLQA